MHIGIGHRFFTPDLNKEFKSICTNMSIASDVKHIEGEVFFLIERIFHIESEQTQFEVGDVVYWQSKKDPQKCAIAMFYGPTKFSDFQYPCATSGCMKIGNILDKTQIGHLAEVALGDAITIL